MAPPAEDGAAIPVHQSSLLKKRSMGWMLAEKKNRALPRQR